MTDSRASLTPPAGRFGTFGGVFTPSILTILGVVMYMRLGWVTGQGGLGVALAIVVVAHLISLATGLSVASIATNRRVGAGGAYFMISRALGAPAGAAIGIPLFFAQALSVTFYIVGFSEAVLQLAPDTGFWVESRATLALILSSLTNLLLAAISFRSADLAIKTQYVVMAAIGLSLISFFLGRAETPPEAIEWVNPEGLPFSTLFAVFFPAVTGIMAGVGMSGDLKDPRTAIPVGTLLAIGVGFVVYLAFPIWLSVNYGNAFLVENVDSVFTLSAFPALIYVGVWGATLSSALGSILTAPRTLQALAWDGLAPRFLGRGYGPSQEPRVGIVLTFLMAQTGIFIGSLDAIAPVLTMFFLATYGVTNLACGLQRWAASPDFRPSFQVPAVLSLLGAFACFYVMSVINAPAMAAAALCCGVIFLWVQRRNLGTTYGDSRHALWAALVRTALLRLQRSPFHPQNWRPNLLVFGGDPEQRPHLLVLASAIVQDRGIVSYIHFLEGEVEKRVVARAAKRERLEPQMRTRFPNVFLRVDICEDRYRAIVAASQSYGVGAFEANAVMLGWTERPDLVPTYARTLRDLGLLDRALLIVRYHEEKKLGSGNQLHLWWEGDERTCAMMLLLAFLLTNHYRFRNMRITVLRLAESDADREESEASLQRLLADARIDAETRVVLRQRRTVAECMHVESDKADLALVGFRLPAENETPEEWFTEIQARLAELPTTILVHSGGSFGGEDVLLDTQV